MTTITILRHRDQIATASTADLVATYNAMTGQSVERFSSRQAAEHRTHNALMSAADAAGHRGVKKGEAPVPMTVAELAAHDADADAPKEPQDGAEEATATEEGAVAPSGEENPFKAGSMAHQLWVATKSCSENAAPRTKKPPKERSATAQPRRTELVVKATFAGLSKIQAGSKRAAVMAYVQQSPDATANLVLIDAAMGESSRGYIQKLLEMKHLEVV